MATARSSRDPIKLGGHHLPRKEKTVPGAIAARGEGGAALGGVRGGRARALAAHHGAGPVREDTALSSRT